MDVGATVPFLQPYDFLLLLLTPLLGWDVEEVMVGLLKLKEGFLSITAYPLFR